MKNPKDLEVVYGRDGQTLISVELPTYKLSEEGMIDGDKSFAIPFAKGVIGDPNLFSYAQQGVFTESLIQAAILYLENVNKGELENIHTTEAIQHLKAAHGCLDARRQKRVKDGTIYTNKQ